MIVKGEGDLLSANVDALVNTVNCVGVMGKGIALQFKRRFPDMFVEYSHACKRGDVQIGRMFVFETSQLEGPRFVVNFPTKKHWRSPSKLSYIEEGLADLVRVIKELSISSIAIPPLGAGNGGLNWDEVHPLIVEALKEMSNVCAVVYDPVRSDRQLDPPETIKMTWGRALLLSLIRGYLKQRRALEPMDESSGASHLEIQKLMYFADYLEPSLELEFTIGSYGPYSDKVRRILQEMEGAYVIGYGDGSSKALEYKPVTLTDRGNDELDRYLAAAKSSRVNDIGRRVLSSVEGFEGPYGVELIASTHWVARKQGARDPALAAQAVRSWTPRKGNIFTNDHVGVALEHVLARPGVDRP